MPAATRPRSPARARARIRRRRLIAGVAVVSLVAGVATGAAEDGDRARPGVAELVAAGRTVARVPLREDARSGGVDTDAVAVALRDALPGSLTVRRGRARVTLRPDHAATAERVRRRGLGGGRVTIAGPTVSAAVRAPVLRQAQANTCESAALSILLASLGRPVDQNDLQAALPTSGPPDPTGTGPERVWGDPDRGYVGRPDGGGVAGGFGVYPGPVQAAARRYGVSLRSLAGEPPGAVYRQLRGGRPVMAWVGLSDGPYGEWRTPDGKPIKVNFGEHTVVLHGIRADGSVLVSNPLEGTREVWSRAQFEEMFERLGRRALTG